MKPLHKNLFLAVAATLLTTSAIHADTFTWNTTGPTNNWNTADANWTSTSSGTLWVDGNATAFSNATGDTLTVSGPISATTMVFSSTGSWTLNDNASSTGAITLTNKGSSVLTVASGNTVEINNKLIFDLTTGSGSGPQISNAGTLKLNGDISVASGASEFVLRGGSGTSTFNGAITLAGSTLLAKTDAGTFVLNKANTLPGGVSFKNGTLLVGDNGAFGAGTVTVNNTTNVFTAKLGSSAAAGNTISLANNFTISGAANTLELGTTHAAATGNLTLTGNITETSVVGKITKTGSSTVTLGGINTFTGNTTVSAGTLILADNAGLKFVIGANGVNNGIGGAGALTLDGDFTFDLTAAATSGTWQIVNNGTLSETYSTKFTVAGFTDNLNNTWSKSANGTIYTFSEATGALTAVPEPAAALLGGLGLLGLLRRRRA